MSKSQAWYPVADGVGYFIIFSIQFILSNSLFFSWLWAEKFFHPSAWMSWKRQSKSLNIVGEFGQVDDTSSLHLNSSPCSHHTGDIDEMKRLSCPHASWGDLSTESSNELWTWNFVRTITYRCDQVIFTKKIYTQASLILRCTKSRSYSLRWCKILLFFFPVRWASLKVRWWKEKEI
jgi:hypothetical protein